jgi:hypothetical protein
LLLPSTLSVSHLCWPFILNMMSSSWYVDCSVTWTHLFPHDCTFSSYSGGTSSHCGKLHTRIGAMCSFGQVDFWKPLKHAEIWWIWLMRLWKHTALIGPLASLLWFQPGITLNPISLGFPEKLQPTLWCGQKPHPSCGSVWQDYQALLCSDWPQFGNQYHLCEPQ